MMTDNKGDEFLKARIRKFFITKLKKMFPDDFYLIEPEIEKIVGDKTWIEALSAAEKEINRLNFSRKKS